MSAIMAIEMGKRVGLKPAVSARIYLNVRDWQTRRGQLLDMVLVAKAIKYVADNRIHLRKVWM